MTETRDKKSKSHYIPRTKNKRKLLSVAMQKLCFFHFENITYGIEAKNGL
ncbi:hypothetical protein AA0522_1859 [Gluconacetobacter liquefaciens NRIC 0522]|nr:hypothetical protein AA0522_1859 [Gluconacetobacter liquefaciens NRIC 0522]